MAKVPALRSGWKIDPAELAVAQERTEARLTDLFSHRPVNPARRAGPHPPIVVDGVQLIGDTEEPVPLSDEGPTTLQSAGDTGRAAEDATATADLVGVVDPRGTDLVSVMVRTSPSIRAVGVMPWPGDEVEQPEQLALDDAPVGVPVMELPPTPATPDNDSAWPWPFDGVALDAEPLVPAAMEAEVWSAGPEPEPFAEAVAEPAPAAVGHAALPLELPEPEPVTVAQEEVLVAPEPALEAMKAAEPVTTATLPVSDRASLDAADLEMGTVEASPVPGDDLAMAATTGLVAPTAGVAATPRPGRAVASGRRNGSSPAAPSKAGKSPSKASPRRSAAPAPPAGARPAAVKVPAAAAHPAAPAPLAHPAARPAAVKVPAAAAPSAPPVADKVPAAPPAGARPAARPAVARPAARPAADKEPAAAATRASARSATTAVRPETPARPAPPTPAPARSAMTAAHPETPSPPATPTAARAGVSAATAAHPETTARSAILTPPPARSAATAVHSEATARSATTAVHPETTARPAPPTPAPARSAMTAAHPETPSRPTTPTAARAGVSAATAAPQPAAGRHAPASTQPSSVVVAAACPYCALLLQPPPTSGRRCPRCRQQIVVKHIEGRTAYLTEAAIAIFEAERRKESDAGRLARERERWLKLAVAAGASAQKAGKLDAVRLSEEAVDASRQLYMGTVDRAFQAAKRDRRWEEAARIRREQAIALHRLAGAPQPPPDDLLAIYREGVTAELRGLAEIVRDAELVSAVCCEPCRADNGRIAVISKELSAPQLPHPGCPKVFCRCSWDLAMRDRELVLRYLRRRPRPVSRSAPKAQAR